MNRHHISKKKKKSVIVATVVFFIVAFCLFVQAGHLDKLNVIPESTDDPYEYYASEDEELIRYDGKWYEPNDRVKNYLLIGIDKYSDEISDKEYFMNDERSDFVLLIAVDDGKKLISPVLINRDTMVSVNKLGYGGVSNGTETMQLALSYSYGSGRLDSCENTAFSVSELFYGIDVNKYYSMTMDAVPVINDEVGGAEVTIDDEALINTDPSFIYGETVTLKGDQALKFVRARMGVGEGLNTERMTRQVQYLKSLKEKGLSKLKSEDLFILNLLNKVEGYSCSNITGEEMINLSDKISRYTIADLISLPGESKVGERFMEFYPDSESLQKTYIDIWFTEAEEE